MNCINHTPLPLKNIVKQEGNFFFGYNDNKAFDESGRYHLLHRTDFWDRLPAPGDTAGLGFSDVESGEYHEFAHTSSFNFQQGSMLEWLGNAENTAVYNTFSDGADRGVIHIIKNDRKRLTDRAFADVSPDGKLALSINFSRIYDFRKVCGYPNIPDRYACEPAPANDGIFLVDLSNGNSRQILSYEQLYEIFNKNRPLEKIVVNHINFSPDSKRFIFLLRTFPSEANGNCWQTAVGTADINGEKICKLSDYGYTSHYDWKNAKEILMHTERGGERNLFLVKDLSGEYSPLSEKYFKKDVHCRYSPDRCFVLTDGYEDNDSFRHLGLYNVEKDLLTPLVSVFSDPRAKGDIRCDLHGRWSPDGKMISFDSTHEGKRGVYLLSV